MKRSKVNTRGSSSKSKSKSPPKAKARGGRAVAALRSKPPARTKAKPKAETKVNTKMTVAMERLAVIAAVTLPVTALASVYGMNVIVNESTNVTQLLLVLLTMLTISGLLLTWAKRQGWW